MPGCGVIFTVRNKHRTNYHGVLMQIGPTTGRYICKWNLDTNQAALLVLDLFFIITYHSILLTITREKTEIVSDKILDDKDHKKCNVI